MASASTPKPDTRQGAKYHEEELYEEEIHIQNSEPAPRFFMPPEAISIRAALESIWREKGIRFVHHRVRWIVGTQESFVGYPLFSIGGVVYGCTRGKKYPEPRRTAKRDYSNNCRRLPGRSPKYD